MSASREVVPEPISIDPPAATRRTRKGSADPPPKGSLGPLPVLAAILLLVVGSAYALLRRQEHEGDDPHFVRARSAVERYELTKAEEARDYGHPVYAQALAELALVDRDSRSAGPADELAEDIRRRATAQQAHAHTQAVEMRTRQELEQGRDEEFFRERRLRPPPDPSTPAPECKEDGSESIESPALESAPAHEAPPDSSHAPPPPG